MACVKDLIALAQDRFCVDGFYLALFFSSLSSFPLSFLEKVFNEDVEYPDYSCLSFYLILQELFLYCFYLYSDANGKPKCVGIVLMSFHILSLKNWKFRIIIPIATNNVINRYQSSYTYETTLIIFFLINVKMTTNL